MEPLIQGGKYIGTVRYITSHHHHRILTNAYNAGQKLHHPEFLDREISYSLEGTKSILTFHLTINNIFFLLDMSFASLGCQVKTSYYCYIFYIKLLACSFCFWNQMCLSFSSSIFFSFVIDEGFKLNQMQ